MSLAQNPIVREQVVNMLKKGGKVLGKVLSGVGKNMSEGKNFKQAVKEEVSKEMPQIMKYVRNDPIKALYNSLLSNVDPFKSQVWKRLEGTMSGKKLEKYREYVDIMKNYLEDLDNFKPIPSDVRGSSFLNKRLGFKKVGNEMVFDTKDGNIKELKRQIKDLKE